MTWTVAFHPAFAVESRTFSDGVRRELFSSARLLEAVGPQLGRPTVDTLKGSRVRNLKELRFTADEGVWRVAFAFDPSRKAILLCGGDKSGASGARFYKLLIKTAEDRYAEHLRDQE
jgi:hypothetical protein